MKVLISGVTGMDGSHMVDYLLENTDAFIYGMVRRSANPNYSNIQHVLNNPRFKMVLGDLSDSQSIDNLVKEVVPDYFINLAAQSFVGSSWSIPEQTFDVDAVGVIRCLEAIRKHASHCRYYNAGSSEEFGDVVYSPQDLNHPSRSRSPYGAAKVAARQIVKVYRESYNLYAIQGLLYNHESERRGAEFVTRKITKNVARIAQYLNEGCFDFEPLRLGALDSKRDWSYAPDFVKGIWLMVNQEKVREDFPTNLKEGTSEFVSQLREYVLSSGETHTVREFVELSFAHIGVKGLWWSPLGPESEQYILAEENGLATKMRVPLVVVDKQFYRPADVELLLGDSALARKELGWNPEVSFEKLVRIMAASDLMNEIFT